MDRPLLGNETAQKNINIKNNMKKMRG